jgi:hypothetical protein
MQQARFHKNRKKDPCAYSNAQAGLQVLGQPNHASSSKRGQRLSGFLATQSQLRFSNPLCLKSSLSLHLDTQIGLQDEGQKQAASSTGYISPPRGQRASDFLATHSHERLILSLFR